MSNQTYAAYIGKINSDFNKYFVLVSSSIGIPCNLVAIFIYARLMRNKTNMGFLCMCQCIVDLYLLLITLLVLRSTPLIFPTSLSTRSDQICKLLTFLRRFSLHISAWMPVLITFDRVIFVLYGQSERFRFMKRKHLLALIILGIFIFLAIADIPNLFFTLTINSQTGVGVCYGTFAVVFSSDMISILLRTYLPLLLMFWFNFMMIRKISANNKRTTVKRWSSLNRKEYHFTFTVMAYSVYFFVINFPLSVFYIIYDINSYTGALTGDFGATYSLLNSVFVNLSFLQQTLSFGMNFASNKLFRKEILVLIGKRLGIRRLLRIQPITQTQTQTRERTLRNNSQN